MIQATSLRIGNWIQDRMGRPYQILGILSGYRILFGPGTDKERQTDDALPIELTPEILEKAGFKKDSDFNFLYLAIGILDFWQGKDGSVNLSAGGGHEYHICEIKYVHQLQNLYFFLTSGEELNIEL